MATEQIDLGKQKALDKSKRHNNHEYLESVKILCDDQLTLNAKKDYIGDNGLKALKKFGIIDNNLNVDPLIKDAIGDDDLTKHRIGGTVLFNNSDPAFRKLAWVVMKVRSFNEYSYATFFHTAKGYDWEDFKQMTKDIKHYIEQENPNDKNDFLNKFKEIIQEKEYGFDLDYSNKEDTRIVEKYFASAVSYGGLFMTFWDYFCPHMHYFDTQKLVDFLESDDPFDEKASNDFFTTNISIELDHDNIDKAKQYLVSKEYDKEGEDPKGIQFEDACYQLLTQFKDGGYSVEAKGSVDQNNHVLLTAPGKTHDMHIVGHDMVLMVEVSRSEGKNQMGYESGCIDHLFNSRFNKENFMIFVAPNIHYKTNEYFSSEYLKRIKNKKTNRQFNPIICMTPNEYVNFITHFKNSDERELKGALRSQAYVNNKELNIDLNMDNQLAPSLNNGKSSVNKSSIKMAKKP